MAKQSTSGSFQRWFGRKCRHPAAQRCLKCVADLSKRGESLGLAARHCGWIGEAPMDTPRRTGEQWAGLSNVVADGDHIVKGLVEILVQVFGALRADIDPTLIHRGNRYWVDRFGFAAGAEDLEL